MKNICLTPNKVHKGEMEEQNMRHIQSQNGRHKSMISIIILNVNVLNNSNQKAALRLDFKKANPIICCLHKTF